ncbi:dorsal-ventral patterning tolloid-like protein 1 [Lytechinus variegatus]|uniref:dorsal-ventral patterning tolloid-like protein 1 n=1 Tax=Lytechinus variegatus TaxID=7654 RepID=UPI001BB2A476|nr:dorsal-ventral patterning tolloid-like protein 1 [Lytechinus variegatus]
MSRHPERYELDHLRRDVKTRYPLMFVLMLCLGVPVFGSHQLLRQGGSRITPDGERMPAGGVRGADDTQMVGTEFAASAPVLAVAPGIETFETAMKGGMAARSEDELSKDETEDLRRLAEDGDTVSGHTKYKMSCFDDDGLYQLDILGGARTGGSDGQLSGQRWSSQGHLDHGHRAPRHAGEVKFRSKKVQWLITDRDDRRDHHRTRRAVTNDDYRIWPNGTIPYTIDVDFDNETKDLLLKSMRHWMDHTCLQFIPRTNQTHYVRFLFGVGCCSSVGRQGGAQNVSLGHGCMTFGTMIHEIGHVIGFWHEQSRTDRDDYVTVVKDNIVEMDKHNFNKYGQKTIHSLGQPYDYDSIMHYGRQSFTTSLGKDTLIPKQDRKIGQREGLSDGDILQARILYRCHSKQECGGTLYDGRGFISPSSYPHPVSPNITCDWSIAAPRGSALKIQFLDMDLPSDDDGKCDDSYVEVREGQGEQSPLIGRFCGDVKPNVILNDGGLLWLRFKSGRKRHRTFSGFAARYQSVEFKRHLTATRGIIKSMNYPLSFPPDTDSMWQIKVREGFIVQLRLNELLIPHIKTTGCHGDYLKLIDGADSGSKLITKLCRSQKKVGVVSSGPSLRIELHSAGMGKKFHGDVTRFLAKYLARDLNECRKNNGGCEQACMNLVGHYVCGCRHGYSMADDYHHCTDIDECASENGRCSHKCVNLIGSYRCECPTGLQISSYNNTHCEDVNECDSPHLDICEHHCHNTYGDFACSCQPGFILSMDGMSCELIPGCGGFMHGVEGVITQPYIPTNNTNSIACFWFIDVLDHLRLSLSLDSFNGSSNSSCADYILIRGEEGHSEQYPRVCSNNSWGRTYNMTSSRAWVHYHSEWPHEGTFLIEYTTMTISDSDDSILKCGGPLNETGVIETPGFPDSYPSKVECTWTISNVSTVAFHYEKFDVEYESSCLFDYLEIRDGPESDVNSTHIGRFCGADPPPNELKLNTGELGLVFRSDATVQGRGFRAVYEVQFN